MNSKLLCYLLLFAFVFLFKHSSFSKSNNKTESKPNIIFILTDDQGYNDLGCYGSNTIETPNIDKLANDGLRLTSFYAQPVCGPSRAALMTGCYPIRIAEPGNKKNQHNIPHTKETTIAEVLKSAGYATGLIGKWHLAGARKEKYKPEIMPYGQGFDYFFGTPLHNGFTRMVDTSRFKAQLMEGDSILIDAMSQKNMNNITNLYTGKAIQFIKENKNRPFFLYLAHNMPHVPLGVSEKFRGVSGNGLYADVIQEVDWSTGEILNLLKELNLEENTLVVFTSDNGPWVEERIGDFADNAAPLRGYKMTFWEGGSRVPCIIKWPGKIKSGRVADNIISIMDFLPTFANIADQKLPHDIKVDGIDITTFLTGENTNLEHDKILYYNWVRLNAIRKGNWKLVLPHPKSPNGTGWSGRMIEEIPKVQLYNLKNDKSEQINVAHLYPQKVDELQRVAEKAREELGDYNRIGSEVRFFDDEKKRPNSIF